MGQIKNLCLDGLNASETIDSGLPELLAGSPTSYEKMGSDEVMINEIGLW